MKKRFTLTKVSARMVQYTADIKRHAIRERAQEMPPRDIFRDTGVPDYFGPSYAVDTYAAQHDVTHFDTDTRGRDGTARLLRHMDEAMTDPEKIINRHFSGRPRIMLQGPT